LLDAIGASRLVEIGAPEGAHSRLLAQWCCSRGARLSIIDTAPRFDATAFETEFNGVAKVYVGPSLNVLPNLPAPDIALIDDDHNWYTVCHELQAFERLASTDGRPFPVCVFHGTAWPYGRRDLYYDPAKMPAAGLHPCKRGPLLPDVS